jgi:hypothetical protein
MEKKYFFISNHIYLPSVPFGCLLNAQPVLVGGQFSGYAQSVNIDHQS